MKKSHFAPKFLLASLGMAALVLSNVAQATVITFRFAMTVDNMFVVDGATKAQTKVQSSNLPGVTFALGDHTTGSLTFDTSAAYSSSIAETSGTSQFYVGGALADLAFVANGWHYVSDRAAGASVVEVGNNAASESGNDLLSFSTGTQYSPLIFQTMFLTMWDRSGTALSSPNLGDVSANSLPAFFAVAYLDYAWIDQTTGNEMFAGGRLSSLELVNGVPEPTSGMLLIAGALAMAGMRRAGRKGLSARQLS